MLKPSDRSTVNHAINLLSSTAKLMEQHGKQEHEGELRWKPGTRELRNEHNKHIATIRRLREMARRGEIL